MELKDIELGDLKPDPNNERGEITEASVKDLAATIKALGLLQPLVVRWAGDDGYFVVAGHRRLVALQVLKKAKVTEADNGTPLFPVPCIERANDATDTVAARLIENLQREDIHPVDEAKGLFQLVGLGVKQKDMGKLLGRSAAHVKDRLRLLELPVDAQTKVNKGELSIKDGLALLDLQKLGSPEKFERAVERTIQSATTGRVEHTVKDHLEQHKKDQAKADLRAKAKAAGVAKVQFGDCYAVPKDGGQLCTPKRSDEESIDVAKHEGEPCHAWLVVPTNWGGVHDTIKAFCTEPDRHRTGGGSKVKWKMSKEAKAAVADAEERQARQAQQLADREVAAERLATLVAKTPAKAAVLDRVFDVVLGLLDWQDARAIIDMLGIECANDGERMRALHAYVADSPKQALQVAWAWALFAGSSANNDSLREAHYRFVVDQGVELTETQSRWMTQRAEQVAASAEREAQRQAEEEAKAAKVAELLAKAIGLCAERDTTKGDTDAFVAQLRDNGQSDTQILQALRNVLTEVGAGSEVADPEVADRLARVRDVLVEEKLAEAQLAVFDELVPKITTVGQAQFIVDQVGEWLSDRPPVDDDEWQPVDEGEWSAITDVLREVVGADESLDEAA